MRTQLSKKVYCFSEPVSRWALLLSFAAKESVLQGGSLYISDTTYGKNYSCYPALSEKMNASGRVLLLASQCSGTREVSWGQFRPRAWKLMGVLRPSKATLNSVWYLWCCRWLTRDREVEVNEGRHHWKAFHLLQYLKKERVARRNGGNMYGSNLSAIPAQLFYCCPPPWVARTFS